MMHELPNISARILGEPDCAARRHELAKLRHAAQHIGFLCITDCEDDVPLKLVEQTFAMSKALFALPPTSLEKIRLNRLTDQSNRGWEGLA
jgi:isopenicillin N synthase-like dioxygenase